MRSSRWLVAPGYSETPQHAGEIETWLREFGLDVVTLESSGAIEFFEAKLNSKGTHP